jgi:cell division protein FtsB
MDVERLKRSAFGCLGLVLAFFVLLGLDNWFGSGPAIREVKQSISSVDSKQFKNASYNDSRIEALEREVKDLKDEVESLKEKLR